jgi:hypothetical protein
MKPEQLLYAFVMLGVMSFSCPDVHAQMSSDTISIGSTTLKLGMTKDSVLSTLGEHYALSKVALRSTPREPIEMWDFRETGQTFPLGSMQFKYGKLSKVGMDLTSDNRRYSAEEIAEVVYGVADTFLQQGNTQCSLGTETSVPPPTPGHAGFKATQIKCGHKTIEILVNWQPSGPAGTQVSEILSDQ